MRMRILAVFFLISCYACNNEKSGYTKEMQPEVDNEIVFNKEKWMMKEGKDYPFREKMLNDVLYNDTIRTLNKDEILNLLGEPDRIQEKYLYYMIAQKRIFDWPLHTRTVVIKFSDWDTVEWIKIHE
jgi:hypothetical protein